MHLNYDMLVHESMTPWKNVETFMKIADSTYQLLVRLYMEGFDFGTCI